MGLYTRKWSWGYREIEIGRDLMRLSGPVPLLKQGQIELGAQHHVRTSSHCLLRWKL